MKAVSPFLAITLVSLLTACGENPGAAPAATGAAVSTSPETAGKARYHCPMHPTFTSDRPGDCPICGMRLVPIPEEAAGGVAAAAPAGPAGLATVTLSPERRQAIGVRTVVVERRPLSRVVRAAGRIEVDERRIHHVHTKFEGWIEDLRADATGIAVRRGQLLFTIYSPEVLATMEEYRIARETSGRLEGSTVPAVAAGAKDLLAAARRRLGLWDIPESEIQRLDRGEKPRRGLPFHSPIDGVVLEKKAVEGLQVMPGDDLFTIAELDPIWVVAEVYDSELSFIELGQAAKVMLSYLPGGERQGTVGFVYPTLDAATRTVRVRVDLANPGLVLRPGMYATVEIRGDRGPVLVVPDSALLHSGTREVAFVDRGDGRLEPREVRTGARTADEVEVVDGLAEGERVVDGANFLVDAESQLKSALSGMAGR